jgi:hypothetical protein
MTVTSLEIALALRVPTTTTGTPIMMWGSIPEITGRKIVYVGRVSGETGTEKIRMGDIVNKNAVDLASDTDVGLKLPLIIKSSTGVRYISGFGSITYCSSRGEIDEIDFTTPSITRKCLSASNNKGNIEFCSYDAKNKVLWCGTGGGGGGVYKLREDLTEIAYKYLNSGYESVPYGAHLIAIFGKTYVYLIGGTHITENQSTAPFIIARIPLQNFISEFDNVTYLSEITGYEELVRDTQFGIYDFPTFHGLVNQKYLLVLGITSAGQKQARIYDITSGQLIATLTDIYIPDVQAGSNHFGKAFALMNGWLAIKSDGSLVYKDYAGNDKLTGIYNIGVEADMWTHGIITKMTSDGYEEIYSVIVNGKIPLLDIDVVNKKVKVVDGLTGNPIQNAKVWLWEVQVGSSYVQVPDATPQELLTDANGEASFTTTGLGLIVAEIIDVP